jgi:uncharacterized cupredoxin-like copper-binding protein
MPKTIRSIAFASALAGAVVLALAATLGRGALAHSDFAAGEPGDPKKAARVIEIVMNDGPGTMTFRPDRIEVRKGEQIRLVLRNVGALRHELLIDTFENNAKHRAEMAKNPGMDHEEANGRHVDPKGTAEILWRFTKAGTFEFACLIPGHYETGMKGVIVVK